MVFPVVLATTLVLGSACSAIKTTLFPNSVPGTFRDALFIPTDTNETRVWLLTDDSLYYTVKKTSPGSTSIRTTCSFCKQYLTLFDAREQKVLKRIKIEFPGPSLYTRLVPAGNTFWLVESPTLNEKPGLYQFDMKTGKRMLDRAGVEKKYAAITGSIIKTTYEADKQRLVLDTSDGLKLYLDFNRNELLTADRAKALDEVDERKEIEVFAPGLERNEGKRKVLYLLRGPARRLMDISRSSDYSARSLASIYDSKVTPLPKKVILLDPIVLYSGKDSAVVLHRQSLEKNSRRLLSCINRDGSLRWRKSPGELLDGLHLDSDDPLTETHFIKDKVRFRRGGDLGVLIYGKDGALGIDYKSGKTLWDL